MKEKPSIMIFSTTYLPLIGGAELAIKEITDRIDGFDFFLITARMKWSLPSYERVGKVEVFRLGIGVPLFDKLYSIPAGMWIAYRIAKKNTSLQYWGMMISFTSLVPVFLKMFGLARNTPFLLTLQEGDSPEHIKRGRLGLIYASWKLSLCYADWVQVISRYLTDMARAYGYTGNITLVPNGVATEHLAHNIKHEAKSIYKTIITVSRLVEKNGVDTLIQAFAQVQETFPDAQLYILGDGPLKERLKAFAQILGVREAVKFLGTVPNKDIAQYLAKAHVFARPSRSEGLGTAFLEAMAGGIPVIATPVGGIPDFLKDGETGLFCVVDNPEDLAKKIVSVFENESLAKHLSENGRKLVEDRYTWNSVAKKMETIFKNLKS